LASDDKGLFDYYANLIRDENDFNFFIVSMDIIKQAYPDVKADPTFIIFKNYDEKKVIFSKGSIPRIPFKQFLRLNEIAIVNNCSDKLFAGQNKKNSDRTLVMLLHPENEGEKYRDDFHQIAAEHRANDIAFILSDIKQGACKNFAERNVIESKHLPTLQIINTRDYDPKRYSYSGPMTLAGMKKFMKDFKEGRAERVFKSEDIPETNEGPVYKGVGRNFEELVIKPNQDVFVKFYAPWCGHCKHLEPIYKELAQKLEGNKNVKFVEVDATKNEIPGIQINGYPTLKFYKANDKKNPLAYDGERTLEAMKKFVADHSSFKEGKTDL